MRTPRRHGVMCPADAPLPLHHAARMMQGGGIKEGRLVTWALQGQCPCIAHVITWAMRCHILEPRP